MRIAIGCSFAICCKRDNTNWTESPLFFYKDLGYFKYEAAPKNKWDWGFMAKKSTGGNFFILFNFFIFLTVYVCTYVYIYIYTGTHVMSDR